MGVATRGPNGSDDDVAENDVSAQAASARQYDWRPRPDPTVLTTQQLRETEVALNRTILERVAGLRELLEQRLSGMDTATELLAERIDRIIPDSLHGRDVLRAERDAAILNLRELLESRIAAIDRATQLLAVSQDKAPSEVEKSVGGLKDLIGSRIDGIDRATRLLAESVSKFPTDIDRSAASVREFAQAQIELALAETRRVAAINQEKFDKVDAQFVSNDKALTAALAAQEKAAAEQQKSNTLAIDKSEKATQETIKANNTQLLAAIDSQNKTADDLKTRVVRIESFGVGAGEARTESRLDRGQGISAVAASIMGLGFLLSVISLILVLVLHK
jgi:hypothetical protein